MLINCRLCLTEDPEEELKNVFQCNVRDAGDSLVDVLFWVFSIEIDVTDPFSKDICSECIQLIEYILQVKNTFQKNQESLNSHLQIQNCESFEVHPVDDDGEKVCNNGQKSPYSITPTSSPSRSRYNSKSVYSSSSPRVRVSLSTLESMCPMNVTLVPLEDTQEYFRYRRLKNGSFKKRKYRHFKMDEALLDDICSTLEDNKCTNTEPLKKEVGVLTDSYPLQSKAINTDETNLCTCYKNISSPLRVSVDTPTKNVLGTGKTKKESENKLLDDNFLDIIGISKNSKLFLPSEEENEYNWTTLSFKKDVSTSTESNIPMTRSIGISAKVHTITTGTLTKKFKQMKQKNVVKINIDSLQSFGPTVVLEPLEDILEEGNYKQIDEFCYIQRDDSDDSLSDCDTLEDLEQSEHRISKQQKFLDYYKNFSSFAVRELIAGKKIRESDSETSPVLKVSNVCSVFVCEFCSKSFLSRARLDFHYRKAHRRRSGDIKDIDLDRNSQKPKKKNFKRKRDELPTKPLLKKNKTKNENSVPNGDCTTDDSTDPSVKCTKEFDNDNPPIKLSSLRRTTKKINYNINDIIKCRTRAKQMPLQLKAKRRRKKKLKQLKALRSEDSKDIPYVWDRKRLGKYKAISYCKSPGSSKENGSSFQSEPCDVNHRKDTGLNDTIQKLAGRLDSSSISVSES